MRFPRGYYDVFVQTCAKYPTNTAVKHYDCESYKCYTYSELYGVCEYIAQNLQQLQCARGVIGLISDRNPMIPCVIAAAHKCCTTFMFLNPTKDLESAASNMQFQIIITIMPNEPNACLNETNNRKPDITITVFNYTIKFYQYSPPNSQHNYRQILEHSFIAMTSGSTGEPKHIQVPVQCIQPNIDDLSKLFNVTPQDVIFFSTPLTFDPSMVEILLACMNGASLLIAPEKADILFPQNTEHSITIWQTTPSKFFQFSNANIKNKILSENSTLRVLALGGEPLRGIKRLKDLKAWDNKTKIFTLYGVTEMSCWACAAELDLTSNSLTDREIPLGRCLSETEVILQPEPNANESVGKIVLVSKSRKCIILKKSQGTEEKNSMKFVDTGDLGEMKNGTIYYRGRKDDIVKRFGNKINLQMIECTVMQCPRVKTCSCVWLPKPNLLVVYFSSEAIGSKDLSEFLKCKLDDKHWPDKIVRVDNLPMNVHGKISKVLLSKLYEKPLGVTNSLDSLKSLLLRELTSTLNCNMEYEVIREKNFFSLGGTSFRAVAMCNKISQTNPNFGKLILPYLITPKCTIDKIMQLTKDELCSDLTKSKRRLKRTASDTGTSNSGYMSPKKTVSRESSDSVEFVFNWSYDTGKCVDGSPTLFESGKNVFVVVGSHSGKVIIFDAASGAVQGIIKVKARVEASVYCYHERPLMIPCGVVGAYDGSVLCFTLDDGELKWKTNLGAMIKSKAISTNGLLYVAAYDGCIHCLDIMTGTVNNIINITDQAISADLVLAKNQFILIGALSGVCASFYTGTNSVAWRGTVGSPIFASPVLYDGDKYVVFAEVNGEIQCRTVEKGIKIWKFQGAKGNIFSSIYVNELDKLKWQLVFGCHDNKVYSIIVKNFQPSLHWKSNLNAPVYSTPCRLNDKLLLAASKNGKIHIIDFENGIILAEYELPNETFSSPAVFNDCIYIGCRDDHVYALKYVLNQ